jgi:hypothetical protein
MSSTATDLTTTAVAALEIELKGYQSAARKRERHLDSMGIPQITGMSTADLKVTSSLCYGTDFER